MARKRGHQLAAVTEDKSRRRAAAPAGEAERPGEGTCGGGGARWP